VRNPAQRSSLEAGEHAGERGGRNGET
jgi:hypothetical protein